MTGAEAERELRKQQRERQRRNGPSTAALEADLWFDVVRHCEGMSDRAVVAEFGAAITAITGIKAASKQRAIVSAARKTKGTRLHLATFAGWGDEAERQLAQAVTEAQAEYARNTTALSQQGKSGGGFGRTDETKLDLELRDALVIENANGESASVRLNSVNDALTAAGFKPISLRWMYRILKK